MQENYEYVQKGFRILVEAMSGYIGKELNRVYRTDWWTQVREALSDQSRNLPYSGSYAELVDSLDIANCIRLLDRRWNEVFRDRLPMDCRSWARELMTVRNHVAHIGQQDLDQPMAERALNTMTLLCREMDAECAEALYEVYRTVRARADAEHPEFNMFLEQPLSSEHRETDEQMLLDLIGTKYVQRTPATHKVTFGGKSILYPVYKVRLDALYYNDQNDRISTWITRYEAENGSDSLSGLNPEIYNRVIEDFIYESNPEALNRTQKNIALIGQQVPGVTLADGRIVDGNRRYTCLRRLQRNSDEPMFFETVLMDMDLQENKKQIKLLELAIQHAEEKKVDYDLIDYAIGTYRDIVQTGLLTEEEYASGTNETVAEVKKRLEIAEIICEFLDHIKMPGMYHTAREYQVYSLFQEMLPVLRGLSVPEKEELKEIAFNNALMNAIPDQRKFIRDIKGLVRKGTYHSYFEKQKELGQQIRSEYASEEICCKEDADRFAASHGSIAKKLQAAMEIALQESRTQQLKAKPTENTSKSIALMMELDPRLFRMMAPEEREKFRSDLEELEKIVAKFKTLL